MVIQHTIVVSFPLLLPQHQVDAPAPAYMRPGTAAVVEHIGAVRSFNHGVFFC